MGEKTEGKKFLKGTLTRDFRPVFFHQTTSSGSLIHRLKPFRIWLLIREDNRQSWLHSGVIETAVTLDLILEWLSSF
jgi:hypothetical protein